MKTVAAKVILVGNEGVGKTSLVLKFIDKNFNRIVTPTIGASLFKCCVNFNDTLINMQIWDTAGQERFRSMVPLYYRNVDVAFIVFDITRHYTFTVAKFWANELILKVDGPVVLTLIGNKKDLSKQRTVSQEEASSFAKEIGAFYYESSTQEFQGVQEIFFNAAKELLKYTDSAGIKTNKRESILTVIDKKTNFYGILEAHLGQLLELSTTEYHAYCHLSFQRHPILNNINSATHFVKGKLGNLKICYRSFMSRNHLPA